MQNLLFPELSGCSRHKSTLLSVLETRGVISAGLYVISANSICLQLISQKFFSSDRIRKTHFGSQIILQAAVIINAPTEGGCPVCTALVACFAEVQGWRIQVQACCWVHLRHRQSPAWASAAAELLSTGKISRMKKPEGFSQQQWSWTRLVVLTSYMLY